MPPTLLAELAVMMSSSPEDVATRALELLLHRSPPARAAAKRLLDTWRGRSGQAIVRYKSQVGGEDEARTDLQGFDERGDVIAIFENKFWAGLTDNQPHTYLARFRSDDGMLVFLVPVERVHLITHELAIRMKVGEQDNANFHREGEAVVAHLASRLTLVVASWSTFLGALAAALEAAEEFDNLADLRQLVGLVEKMGREGFRPFTPLDLTGDTPRLVLRLVELVDSAIELLLTKPFADKKGLKATAWRGSYGHYFKMHGFGCHLGFSPQHWAANGGSPIWLRVSSKDWRFPETLREVLRATVDNPSLIQEDHADAKGFLVPIRLAEGRERNSVLADVLRQLENVAAALAAQASSVPKGLEEVVTEPGETASMP